MDCTTFESILKPYEDYQKVIDEYNKLLHGNLFHDIKAERALMSCGEWLGFAPDSDGVIRLKSASFCRKRICPMCQWRKSQRQFSDCLRLADVLEEKGYRFLHLVLTVPNCSESELAQTVDKLYKSFSKFWRYKDIKNAFKGVLRCLELTYNYEAHTFHPHLHCLVAVNKSYFTDIKVYLSHKDICELWSRANGSDQPLQCSVGKIKNRLGFAEVSKYCVKPLQLNEDSKYENIVVLTALLYTLKGRRFVQSYGIIKDELKKIKNTDDVETVENSIDNEQMFVYHYNQQVKKYEKI